MKVTKVEIIRNRKPIPLPEEWRPAWWQPDGKPIKSFGFSFYRVHTDDNIVGIGPCLGDLDPFAESVLMDFDPFYVEKFWSTCMKGRETSFNRGSYGGLEIALWDIVGKALNKPVFKILGAHADRIMAYAATSRLLKAEEHVKQVLALIDMGFKAVKLRLHRPRPEDDLEVIAAVRDAAGEELAILVDANQNNRSANYQYWSRKTALWMAKKLDDFNVYFLEEPLPKRDIGGLAELAASVDVFIAGGEHSANVFEFKEHILRSAYDILQPDVILGDIGITGIRKVAIMADYFGKMLVPHVCTSGNLTLNLASTLQAVATIDNCPMVEYPFDPPILTVETQQPIFKDPILVAKDGFIRIRDKPGIGVEIDEDKLSKYT